MQIQKGKTFNFSYRITHNVCDLMLDKYASYANLPCAIQPQTHPRSSAVNSAGFCAKQRSIKRDLWCFFTSPKYRLHLCWASVKNWTR